MEPPGLPLQNRFQGPDWGLKGLARHDGWPAAQPPALSKQWQRVILGLTWLFCMRNPLPEAIIGAVGDSAQDSGGPVLWAQILGSPHFWLPDKSTSESTMIEGREGKFSGRARDVILIWFQGLLVINYTFDWEQSIPIAILLGFYQRIDCCFIVDTGEESRGQLWWQEEVSWLIKHEHGVTG